MLLTVCVKVLQSGGAEVHYSEGIKYRVKITRKSTDGVLGHRCASGVVQFFFSQGFPLLNTSNIA